ncbi:nucleotidyl transferase AbiEii/AbiGii toxin family protein [Salinimicrobium sp. TH3]|uniref:nucleotidyl transferase AbiEii/AbiGii toxin family protein n=1 Tax=Salinimicrobium sp. TH3 TaxID=2997342 RepID=UPI00227539F3|nr:nucleotidyl transferase AbiEii/AbiGii toxin family protein [Salinimicrobium sp. TH3]MCY2685863.1 nucleotidyl transferase AbiEii/AbiGii toxin family protein [Salinimicrobium sp. TH3]
MEEWFKLSIQDRELIIKQVSSETGLLPVAVEKDLWVMIALRGIFSTELKDHLVFKGGTSLSKAWGIIERFSEDIDLAIDRSFFGFNGDLSRQQIKNLRKASCKYVSKQFCHSLHEALSGQGVKEFELSVTKFEESDTDPLAVELRYKSLVDKQEYLQPRILIEISSRSLIEPYEVKELRSLISEIFPDQEFAGKPVDIPTVLPSRTLLEKMFLLHEEFQKPNERKIRSARMTRHLYDISKLMATKYLEDALTDKELYSTIVEHRQKFTRISWVDYSRHQYGTLQFLPPDHILTDYRSDYEAMRESMFYGNTESFDNLLIKLRQLNERVNGIQ